MKAQNPVENLHHALASAVYKDFPMIQYEDRDWEHYRKTKQEKKISKERNHSEYDLSVVAMFPQMWGSTALGFGGIGGAAMTEAYTIVIKSTAINMYSVYFGGTFAYSIQNPNKQFFEDMLSNKMSSVKDKNKYL